MVEFLYESFRDFKRKSSIESDCRTKDQTPHKSNVYKSSYEKLLKKNKIEHRNLVLTLFSYFFFHSKTNIIAYLLS